MSLLVRPDSPHSQEFLTRPNTYTLQLPTGADFYFSIPFNMDWLCPLRPIELDALYNYLSAILGDVAKKIGQVGMYSIFEVQHEISARLSSADQLREIENGAWAAGHGYPVFDRFRGLTTFFWDWNAIHFKCGPSVVAWYVRGLYDFQYKPGFERYAVRRSIRLEENKIGYGWWFDDGQLIVEWYCGRKVVCVKTCGAAFRDLDEWRALKAQLGSYELDMLRKGKARIRNSQKGGWELVKSSNEGRNGTTSDISSLERAYDPYIPAANIYFHQGCVPEETKPSDSNSGDRFCCHHAPSPSPSEHAAERLQTFDTRTSQTSQSSRPIPPHPSELLEQAHALSETVRDLEARVLYGNKTGPSRISPKSLAHSKPFLNHTVPPALQLPAQTATFPGTNMREDSTPTQQSYQAYAEDEIDDDTEESVRAPPNSWRDI
ncbi:hypothetical protein yc1106_00086 [Curvularia clavata]|uniref:Uncharacterized protein n=1 Tax=Curvularia clavata TaxID=95742 RepID=A0A9Q8YZI1_CURCL|nr:hypothetical protein yc1106_00086 [Curvularia clavata]